MRTLVSIVPGFGRHRSDPTALESAPVSQEKAVAYASTLARLGGSEMIVSAT
jgi:hypothetical protein